MVIGVDAGALAEKDERLHVGVYRVTHELLKYLSEIDTVNTYRLYSYAPIPSMVIKNFGKNMINISSPTPFAYMCVQLPVRLLFAPVDLFLGVAQAVPYGIGKSIGFIYDLGFLHHPEVYGRQAIALERQTEALIIRSFHIITISEASKRDIMDTFRVEGNRVTVAYPGVSEVFRKNKEKMIHPNPYFLMVGFVNPGKNIPLAISAFEKFMRKVNKPYDLVIIGGDTGLDPEIQKTIDRFHLHNHVHLLGRIPDMSVAKWYKSAVGLLALSVTEGFCLPSVEALASGCPVIYAKNGALPEIVGEAGIGVSIKNEKTIIDAMMLMTRRKIDTQKRAEKYQWQTFTKKIYDCIGSCTHTQ